MKVCYYMRVKTIAVGSKNPVKAAAVKAAFDTVWPEEKWQVEAVEVESDVPEQPMNDEESIGGATTRAKRALKELNCAFGVGLEGGLQKFGTEWFDVGWIVVIDQTGKQGIGSTIRIQVPDKMMKLIKEGKDLGEVGDIVFGKTNSKQKQGFYGLMTDNAITRTRGYTDGTISALVPFLHPDIFYKESNK